MRDFLLWVPFVLVFLIVVRIEWPKIDPNEAIPAIVGEASNQSQATMICVAHALRNRGTLKGVNGARASHTWNEPEEVWEKARAAWDYSEDSNDPTHGAKNFGTLSDLNKLHVGMTKVKRRCGDFYFY